MIFDMGDVAFHGRRGEILWISMLEKVIELHAMLDDECM